MQVAFIVALLAGSLPLSRTLLRRFNRGQRHTPWHRDDHGTQRVRPLQRWPAMAGSGLARSKVRLTDILAQSNVAETFRMKVPVYAYLDGPGYMRLGQVFVGGNQSRQPFSMI